MLKMPSVIHKNADPSFVAIATSAGEVKPMRAAANVVRAGRAA